MAFYNPDQPWPSTRYADDLWWEKVCDQAERFMKAHEDEEPAKDSVTEGESDE